MTKKKSILIIATERGLGLGLARQFFGRGWEVCGTTLPGADTNALCAVGAADPARLQLGNIDVTKAEQIAPFKEWLGERRFDVIFMNAGIYGPLHQSVLQASDHEFANIMLTNAFGPVRLARHLLEKLKPEGTLAFMSSHRASIAMNVEAGLELYRASKVAQNMLARGIHADMNDGTVLSIHPGWVNTAMGTLDGTVAYEIELEPSVQGVADVVEQHMGSGQNLYLDYTNQTLPW